MALLPAEQLEQVASTIINNTTCLIKADEQSGSFAAAKVFFESSVLVEAGE